jgi:hypothetical protein
MIVASWKIEGAAASASALPRHRDLGSLFKKNWSSGDG